MELRDLRYFVTVADCAGFSRAAEKLGISQPALSRQIKSLEVELGVQLFDRVGRRTLLTAAGADLLRRGRTLLYESDAIKARANELAGGSHGLLRLGATPQSYESFIARLLARFRRACPTIEITLVEDGAAGLLEAVRSGSIHIAVASLPIGTGLGFRSLFPFGVIAVVSRAHPLARLKTIGVADLARYPLLLLRKNYLTRQLFDRVYFGSGREANIMLESNSAQSLVSLAENGHGVAIVPSTLNMVRSQVRAIPLQFEGKQIGLWVSVIWDKKRYLTPAAKTFIDIAYRFTRRQYPGRAFHFEQLGYQSPPEE